MQHPLVTLKVVCVLAGLRISQIILTGHRDLVPPHRPTLAHLRATEVQGSICTLKLHLQE